VIFQILDIAVQLQKFGMSEYEIFDAAILHLTQNLDLQLQCHLDMPQFLHPPKSDYWSDNSLPSTILQDFTNGMQSK